MKKHALQSMMIPVVIGALCVGAASAGPGSCGHKGARGDKPHRMWEALNLDEDQKARMKEIHDEMKTVRSSHWKEVRAMRDKLREELQKENPDKATLDAYAEQMGEQAKAMAERRTDHLLKIREVLSAEQFKTLMDKGPGMCHRGEGCKRAKRGGCPKGKGGSVQ
jgi:Spy/CpxP family protein refolding chaperone